MDVEVRYYCPRCGAVVSLERDAYLADKSVTPYPLSGWRYARPDENYERSDVDGVRFVCGESDATWDDEGCGEPFYLNFVKHEDGEAIEPRPESEHVRLNVGEGTRTPDGPTGPGGPN